MRPTMDGSIAISLVWSLSSAQKVHVYMATLHHMVLMVLIGEIIGGHTNCPGSWHDSRVAEGIYEMLEHHTLDGYCIVANSAFPTGHDRVSGKIIVLLKTHEDLPLVSTQQAYAIKLSRSILSYHQTAKWGMRELQGSFS